VNTAVNQMDQVTQQNAAMVEQSTAASHSLTQEAEELMRLVAQFQTGEASGAGHAPGRQAHARPSQSQPAVLVQRQRAVAFASRGSAALKQDPVQQKDDWQEF
jgi:methyl-accepting chemotaxis protein